MRENIILKEQDLFNYVFFKRQIDEKKLHLLENYSHNFELTLLKSIRESLGENLPVFIKEKIHNRIKCYNPINNILLNLIKEIKHKEESQQDISNKHHVSKSTFIDDGNIYLIRLINYKESSSIFLFSRDEERINNYTLILNPGKETFDVKNNFIPLKIDHQVIVSHIEMIFD